MSLPGQMRRAAQRLALPARGAIGRLREVTPRPSRFAGAYPSRDAALAALPERQRPGYALPGIEEISVEEMSQVALWDYPVLHWMAKAHRPGLRVLDAGGHLGTKRVAFAPHLPMAEMAWTVFDLPGIVARGRAWQAEGRLPGEMRFVDDLAQAGETDLLLVSGLLQYAPGGLAELVAPLPAPPPVVLLNKVAVRDGPEVVTLERIGPARVPYRIRNRSDFEAHVAGLGYVVDDTWSIDALGHEIATHPWLGRSQSRGYALRRIVAKPSTIPAKRSV